jgi:hypothetical protein
MEETAQSHECAALPSERTPGSHCEGGWLGFRTGPKGLEKGEISYPFRESNFIKGVAV